MYYFYNLKIKTALKVLYFVSLLSLLSLLLFNACRGEKERCMSFLEGKDHMRADDPGMGWGKGKPSCLGFL